MARLRRHPASDADQVTVSSWRIERLSEAGFAAPLANRLACDSRYDLHVLLELVDGGCPPELATRILAPLEGDQPG